MMAIVFFCMEAFFFDCLVFFSYWYLDSYVSCEGLKEIEELCFIESRAKALLDTTGLLQKRFTPCQANSLIKNLALTPAKLRH